MGNRVRGELQLTRLNVAVVEKRALMRPLFFAATKWNFSHYGAPLKWGVELGINFE